MTCPWGKLWTCHVCKSNYNRHQERTKSNPNLRKWWTSLSKEEKTSWFLRNRDTYEPGKRKSFDNAGFYVESSGKGVKSRNEI